MQRSPPRAAGGLRAGGRNTSGSERHPASLFCACRVDRDALRGRRRELREGGRTAGVHAGSASEHPPRPSACTGTLGLGGGHLRRGAEACEPSQAGGEGGLTIACGRQGQKVVFFSGKSHSFEAQPFNLGVLGASQQPSPWSSC